MTSWFQKCCCYTWITNNINKMNIYNRKESLSEINEEEHYNTDGITYLHPPLTIYTNEFLTDDDILYDDILYDDI